jgi:hypothetical protein
MGYLGGALEGFSKNYKKKKKKAPDDSSKAGQGISSGIGKIIGSFKKGGRVKRTGNYRLHAGEKVVTAKRARGRRSKSR